MVTRTFIDKSTTIFENSIENFGLNPITVLCYGKSVARSLLHFNVDKLKKLHDDKTYPDLSKLKHVLHMKNCGSLSDMRRFKQKIGFADENGLRERATSFDIIVFKIPQDWDEGIGFDHGSDFWLVGKSALSENGCTWNDRQTLVPWETPGIYTNQELSIAYQEYSHNHLENGEVVDSGDTGSTAVVIARQHFDHGNEDLEIDITDYVNELISNEYEPNYGIGLAFSPMLESSESNYTQYVGFFNNKTNTFFEPYIETRYESNIHDDRYKFYIGKENSLCLYTMIDGELQNLDERPICTIDGVEYPVEQQSKGVYTAKVKLASGHTGDEVLYDEWSNLYFNGEEIEPVELQFATKRKQAFFSFGETMNQPKILNPILTGINDNENLLRTDVRTIKVSFREQYTHSDYQLLDNAQYRLYTKEGNREVTVIDWDEILTMNYYNYFTLDIRDLVPQEYHLDVRSKFGTDLRVFKDVLKFKVASDVIFLKM